MSLLVMQRRLGIGVSNMILKSLVDPSYPDSGTDIVLDSQGNVFTVGLGTDGTVYSAILARYTAEGTLLWQKGITPITGSVGGVPAVSIDASDNIYVAGHMSGSGSTDLFLVKTDTSGDIIWQKTFGTFRNESCANIDIDVFGNIYLLGRSFDIINPVSFLYVSKFDSSGNFVWQRRLEESNGRLLSEADIHVTNNNNVIVCGSVFDDSNVQYAIVASYDSSGTMNWYHTLGSNGGNTSFSRITSDVSSNIYLVGKTSVDSFGGTDLLMVKYTSSGSLVWQNKAGTAGNETARGCIFSQDGNLLLTGNSTGTGLGSTDLLLLKCSSSGLVTGSQILGAPALQVDGYALVEGDSYLYINGYTYSSVQDILTAFRIHKSATGNQTIGDYSYQPTSLLFGSASLGTSGQILLSSTTDISQTRLWVSNIEGTTITPRLFGTTVDSEGNVYSCGSHMFVIKQNSSGETIWQKQCGESNDWFEGIDIDPSETYIYMVGWSDNIAASREIVLVKMFANNGGIVWQRRIGSSSSDSGAKISVNRSTGNVYIIGTSSGTGLGSTDIFIARVSSGGSVSWQRRFGGSSSDVGIDIITDSDENVYFVGRTQSSGTGTKVVLGKCNSVGTLSWQRTLGSTSATGTKVVLGK